MKDTSHAHFRSRARGAVEAFVDAQQQRGRYSFTEAELAATTSQTTVAQRAALRRLHARRRIVRPLPRHGFFVIVPHEYYSIGAPPSTWYLDALMQYLNVQSYYIGLLSAAAWYGATHIPVQETQIVVSKQLRSIHIGRERIRFFTKAAAADTPIHRQIMETGILQTSTPEATAIDLVRYLDAAGGLNTVVTVLAELHPRITPRILSNLVTTEENVAIVQRLGYLLERVAAGRMTESLARWLTTQQVRVRPLDVHAPIDNTTRDERWHLWVNAPIAVST